MKLLAILVLLGGVVALVLGAAATQPAADVPTLRPDVIPLGALGHPLGDYLTVEGSAAAARDPYLPLPMFRIDTVNGRRLDKAVNLVVENVDLPAKRCTLKGYESVRMTGAPPAVVAEAAERGVEMETIPWRQQLYFVALKAVDPADLPVRPRR